MINNGEFIVSTSEQEGDELLNLALSEVEQLFNMSATRIYKGYEVSDSGEIVWDDQVVHVSSLAALALKSALTRAYLAGRADQVSDMFESNTRRTVKARNLGAAIDLANESRPSDDQMDKRELLDSFDLWRGAANPGPIQILAEDRGTGEDVATLIQEEKIAIYNGFGEVEETIEVLALKAELDETEGDNDE